LRSTSVPEGGFIAIVEVCGFNDWLLKLLAEYGCRETILIQPEKRSKKKTDRCDANALGELLWVNRQRLLAGKRVQGVRRVQLPSPLEAEDRQLTALRQRLGQIRTRTINKIKHLLRKHNREQECPTKGLDTIRTHKGVGSLYLTGKSKPGTQLVCLLRDLHRELQGVIDLTQLDCTKLGNASREPRLRHRQEHVAIGKRGLRHPIGLRERNFTWQAMRGARHLGNDDLIPSANRLRSRDDQDGAPPHGRRQVGPPHFAAVHATARPISRRSWFPPSIERMPPPSPQLRLSEVTGNRHSPQGLVAQRQQLLCLPLARFGPGVLRGLDQVERQP
jgi:hypothetical protein